MKYKKFGLSFFLFVCTSVIISTPAKAYLSLAESGELIPKHGYQLGLETQALTNLNSGLNLNLLLDAPVNDSTTARLELGGGSIDFNAFASLKWMPFPDVDNQPAMGLRFGAGFARDENQNFVQAQVSPLISKKYEIEYGMTVPYFALPFTLINNKDETFIATNVTVGSEFQHREWKTFTVGGEIGLDLNKSWSYVSLFAKFPFESSKGFGK